jgi:DNA-binding PucR family transcriptional regulator
MSPAGPEPDGAALERGLLLLRRRLGGRAPLHAILSGHGVLLSPDGRLRAGELLTAFEFPVVVGAGRPRPHLELAADSYAEARQAAEIALRVPSLGPTAEWSRLGVYRMLTRLPADAALDAHPGLEALLDGAATLAYTLEVYLDLAGNTHAAADRLRLHRTTLYHRLHRIERLTGADLGDGEERLALHLGLKQARITGRYRPPA